MNKNRKYLGIVGAVLAPTAFTAIQAAAGQPPVDIGVQTAPDEKVLGVFVGQSQLVTPPWPVARVSVTDPEVVNVEVLTPDQILVMGKRAGSTDLVAWSKDEQVWRTRVDVGIDLPRMKGDLARMFEGSEIDVSMSQNILVVSGSLHRMEEAAMLREFLDKTGLAYLDKTGVAGVQQVLIRVRVAEVSRSAVRTLGVNTYVSGSDFFGGLQPGPLNGGALNPGFTIGPEMFSSTVSPSITMFGGVPDWDLNFFIQALHENQYLRVLAEPSLKCLSGEEANFLAGGEYPIPVVQGGGGGGAGATTSITIEYREFGVRLRFKPVVLGDNTIRLNVAPEVSELSDKGAVTIQGFQVPSLLTRRAETTLELKSGQTFALAGLINQRADARNSRVPGFGDLPILGPLFRSVRYNMGETELIVMVTADLVEPLNLGEKPAMPGALHTPPNDWELYATGQLVGVGSPKVSPSDAAWMKEKGLDRLRGPGAWANHDQPAAQSGASARPKAQPGEHDRTSGSK